MTVTTIEGKSLSEQLAENYKRTLPTGRGGTAWTMETFSTWVSLRYPEVRVVEGQEWKSNQAKSKLVCEEHGPFTASPNNVLRNRGNQCRGCRDAKCKESTGAVRRRNSTPEERQRAIELYAELGNYAEVGRVLGRSANFAKKICNPGFRQRRIEYSRQRGQSPEVKARASETRKIRHQTPHGKESYRIASSKRRALTYEAVFPVFVGDDKELETVNCYEGKHLKGGKGITNYEESLYFVDAESIQEYAKLQAVADKMAEEYGEKFHVDHLVPLSRGGCHHSSNFQIKTQSANCTKNDKRIIEDEKLFCLRLFGTCAGYVSTSPIHVGSKSDGFLYQALTVNDLI